MNRPEHRALHDLIVVFFGQDMDLFGDSIDEVLDAYVANSSSADWAPLRADIARFMATYTDEDADRAFAQRWHNDFDPSRWGLSAMAFLRRVEDRLRHCPNGGEAAAR
jgi:CdiI immunity protein